MNTVGYGDIVPQNDIERIFCIFFIYIACGLFAYTLNVVGNIIQQISKNKSQFLNNIMVINGYLNKKNINFDLRMRIRKYLEYVLEEEITNNNAEENSIIDKLSSSLKEELLLETNGKILKGIPFFINNFSEETLRKLVFKLMELHYMPGDIIYQQGDYVNNSLYIVWKGEVELYMDLYKKEAADHVLQKIKQKNTLGEKEFITGCPREVSARSSSFSTVYELKFNDFVSILQENTQDYTKFIEIKDKAGLYKNYLDVQIFCDYCQDMNHSMVECPFLHLMLMSQRVIQKYNYYKPNERKTFTRKLRVKFNARKKRKLCEFISNTMKIQQVFFDSNSSENVIPCFSERALINNVIEKKKNCSNSSENEEILEEDEEEESSNDFVLNVADKTSSRIDFPDVLLDKQCSMKVIEKKKKNEVPYTSSDFNNFPTIPPKQIDDESSPQNKFSMNKTKSGSTLKKIMSEKEKGTNLNFDLILFFEKLMDYENYFPHNNSHIVIQLYNKSRENDQIFKGSFSIKKGRKGKMREPSINKESILKYNESVVSILNPGSPKKQTNNNYKSYFFKFNGNNHEKTENLDRNAIIKLLKRKRKEQNNESVFIKMIKYCLNFFIKEKSTKKVIKKERK